MTGAPIQEILETFTFLDERTALEPFLYDILMEIKAVQKKFNERKEKFLATKAHIKQSNNIRMPFTPARNKNIEYILELLTDRYPDYVHKIIHFNFDIDSKTKKLLASEVFEYTVNLSNKAITSLQANRDNISLDSLDNLIKKFRIFNLTKIIRQIKNKKDISRVIKKGLGTKFFTFKHFSLSNNNMESSEDFCFHSLNYEAVKQSLDIEKLKEIISTYEELIKHRLKKFGIINTIFSDYSDNKLNYILHVLIDDLQSSLSPSDYVEVKNFHSLRECMIKVDKILDPSNILGDDIVKFIRDTKFCSEKDIISNVLNLNKEILNKWASTENLNNSKIVFYTDADNQNFYLDGETFIPAFQLTYETLCTNPERLKEMSTFQREFIHKKIEIYYNSAKQVIGKSESKDLLHADETELVKLKHLINEYEQYLKKINLEQQLDRQESTKQGEKKSIIKVIITGIFSIFSMFSKKSSTRTTESISEKTGHKKHLLKATKQIYTKATAKNDPIIPLSNLLELNHENDALVDEIISQLRDNNMKIVVPIYNARTVLYPKRSQKLLIADIEYLLVPPHVIKTPESITEYIDSLVGFKIKNDVLQGKSLIVIEKYLRTLQRQRRAQLLNKKNG